MASSSAWNERGPVWASGFPGTMGTALSITAFWERAVRVRSSGPVWGPKGVPGRPWPWHQRPAARRRVALALETRPFAWLSSFLPPPPALPRRTATSRGWDEQVTRECCGRSQREPEPGKVLGRREERNRLRDLGEGWLHWRISRAEAGLDRRSPGSLRTDGTPGTGSQSPDLAWGVSDPGLGGAQPTCL